MSYRKRVLSTIYPKICLKYLFIFWKPLSKMNLKNNSGTVYHEGKHDVLHDVLVRLLAPKRPFSHIIFISSTLKGSAFLFLFHIPFDFSCFRLAISTSLEWVNPRPLRMLMLHFSVMYLLIEAWIDFMLSGSLSSCFWLRTARKNLAR